MQCNNAMHCSSVAYNKYTAIQYDTTQYDTVLIIIISKIKKNWLSGMLSAFQCMERT